MNTSSVGDHHSSWSVACVALSLALAAVGVRAQSDAIQSPVGTGLALVEHADGDYRVEHPDGGSELLEVPAGSRLSAFHETEDGWVAAGARWVDRHQRLVVLAKGKDEAKVVESPGNSGQADRQQPVPLIARGRLVGMAWLDGYGQKNAVVAAVWTGRFWDEPIVVAEATPEAQLGLSGTVLADGSLLLVWAAFVEGDDDILWSRHDGVSWSKPAMLHADNVVPDILPQVIATDDGALASWSAFDGSDYRLRLSQFDGSRWAETEFRGESGSLQPTFSRSAGRILVLYSAVSPSTWSVVELEQDGRVSRAALARAGEPRPMLVPAGVRHVLLRWPADSDVREGRETRVGEYRLQLVAQP